MPRTFLFTGAALAVAAIGAGAFGAHALRDRLSAEMLAVYETGARYQMYHALALIGVVAVRAELSSRALEVAGWLFVVGVLLFSGSLYSLALGGPRWLGAVAPVGGVALMAGWGTVAVAAWRRVGA